MVDGRTISLTMNDFWRWSYSDLADSRNLSVMAEFIVASSIGALQIDADTSRSVRRQCSLLSPDGYRLDIKSAAYAQSWDAEHPDHVSFQIAKSMIPDYAEMPVPDTPPSRKSDACIFCVCKAMEKCDSPLDLDLWEFYVLPTSVLGETKPNKKTITLPSIMKLEPVWSDYYGIAEAIRKAVGKSA